jgi:ribonuclease E
MRRPCVAAATRPGRPELENVFTMLDNEPTGGDQAGTPPAGDAAQAKNPTRRTRSTQRRTSATAPPEAAAEAGQTEPAGQAAVPAKKTRSRRRAAEPDASAVSAQEASEGTETAPTPAKAGRAKATAAKATVAKAGAEKGTAEKGTAEKAAPAKATRRRKAAASAEPVAAAGDGDRGAGAPGTGGPAMEGTSARATSGSVPTSPEPTDAGRAGRRRTAAPAATVLFMAPEVPESPPTARRTRAATATEPPAPGTPVGQAAAPVAEAEEPTRTRSRRRGKRTEPAEPAVAATEEAEAAGEPAEAGPVEDDEYEVVGGRRRRRRGRRGRGRGKGPHDEEDEALAYGQAEPAEPEADTDEGEEPEDGEPVTRKRRRRRRGTSAGEGVETTEDGVVTVVKVRQPRAARDEVQGVTGSTRLEAKRQRRRDGRDQRRTRPPILSESEFLARREAVDRSMVIRDKGDRTQIAVLEDGVLVEHYVTRAAAGSMVGNVYLGKVQNVLPSMEAAFVDIGRGRNAVLYAGEVNWDATGLEGRARSIEQALKAGDSVLVQVTKEPIGHKGARLTSHIALSGRHLVYVPHGTASGISRKLPDTERKRLRDILKHLVPEGAGVIVRTAAEGASEPDLERDVTRLQAQWEDIQVKASAGGAPVLLYEEPDLAIRVVRDLFNEDFKDLVIQGSQTHEMVEMYLKHVSPDLVGRLRRPSGSGDAFVERRIDEQLLKGLDRKVYLPSGGSLVIDRTEAMTVIDVNTGKYTGTGGNLEETVTRNNLEAAEEIVRQLRLRDLGGIIVIDFIDMVLESNRELVLRRLTECLGRDRTKHQVTEITSLGLVQMTRKRIGQGLLEAFSETCETCKGRGVIIHTEPVAERKKAAPPAEVVTAGGGRRRGRRGQSAEGPAGTSTPLSAEPELPDPGVAEARLDDEELADAELMDAALTDAEVTGAGAELVDSEPADAEPADVEEDPDAETAEDLVGSRGTEPRTRSRSRRRATSFDPIEPTGPISAAPTSPARSGLGNGGERFTASPDDPDAVGGAGGGQPSAGGRRRVLWGSRRGRPRP